MKKKLLGGLLLVCYITTFMGCSGKEKSTADKSAETTEAGADKKAGDDTEQSEKVSNWDGYLTMNGIKIKAGMTIQELLDQGVAVKYVPYGGKGAFELYDKKLDAPVEQNWYVVPNQNEFESYGVKLSAKNEKGAWQLIECEFYIVNPNPYATPINECVLAGAFDIRPYVKEMLGLDVEMDKVTYDDVETLFGEPDYKSDENGGFRYYDFGDYRVSFSAHDSNNIYHGTLQLKAAEDDNKYVEPVDKYYDYATESIEPDINSPYEFKMGLHSFELLYENCDMIKSDKMADNDYANCVTVKFTENDVTYNVYYEGLELEHMTKLSEYDYEPVETNGVTYYKVDGYYSAYAIRTEDDVLITVTQTGSAEKDWYVHALEVAQKALTKK